MNAVNPYFASGLYACLLAFDGEPGYNSFCPVGIDKFSPGESLTPTSPKAAISTTGAPAAGDVNLKREIDRPA